MSGGALVGALPEQRRAVQVPDLPPAGPRRARSQPHSGHIIAHCQKCALVKCSLPRFASSSGPAPAHARGLSPRGPARPGPARPGPGRSGQSAATAGQIIPRILVGKSQNERPRAMSPRMLVECGPLWIYSAAHTGRMNAHTGQINAGRGRTRNDGI